MNLKIIRIIAQPIIFIEFEAYFVIIITYGLNINTYRSTLLKVKNCCLELFASKSLDYLPQIIINNSINYKMYTILSAAAYIYQSPEPIDYSLDSSSMHSKVLTLLL